MADVEISDGELVVRVQGFDRVFALRSEVRVPLQHIAGAASGQDDAANWFHGIKAPGTSVPGVIVAGTFYWHGDCAFYDVHHPEKAVAITLKDEKYQRLVVEVEDPAADAPLPRPVRLWPRLATRIRSRRRTRAASRKRAQCRGGVTSVIDVVRGHSEGS